MLSEKSFEKLECAINMKIFFRVEDKQHSITYNHYGVVAKRQDGKWLNLLKSNGEEVMVNLDNVNQIVTI